MDDVKNKNHSLCYFPTSSGLLGVCAISDSPLCLTRGYTTLGSILNCFRINSTTASLSPLL